MNCTRSAALSVAMLLLAACGGGGADSPPPPAYAPQIHTATVTGVETVRAADQLALPVTGLPAVK